MIQLLLTVKELPDGRVVASVDGPPQPVTVKERDTTVRVMAAIQEALKKSGPVQTSTAPVNPRFKLKF